MPRQAFADLITDWEKLLTTVAANKDDLTHVDAFRQQLEVEATGAKAANIRQLAAQAEAQQASRDLDDFRTRGRDLANRINAGIKSKYGIRSEKLKEFDIKVFRGGKKTVKPTSQVNPPTAGPPVGANHPGAGTAAQAAPANEAPQNPTARSGSE
ncbi:MAG TPA: hypothetical protein VGG20_28475 [Thermoanaerobaculia bacterium]|jgi:hypothetical protein